MAYANVSRPLGFIPIFPVGRANTNQVVRPIPSVRTASAGGNASTDLAIGDAYALDANGNAYRAGPNDVVSGIVIGFVLAATPAVMGGNGPVSIDYITGTGTFPNLIGVEDNGAEFNVQADNFTAALVGQDVNLVDAAPDSTLRQSRQKIGTGVAGSQFRCIALVNSPADNAYGANARVVVRMLTAKQG